MAIGEEASTDFLPHTYTGDIATQAPGMSFADSTTAVTAVWMKVLKYLCKILRKLFKPEDALGRASRHCCGCSPVLCGGDGHPAPDLLTPHRDTSANSNPPFS